MQDEPFAWIARVDVLWRGAARTGASTLCVRWRVFDRSGAVRICAVEDELSLHDWLTCP